MVLTLVPVDDVWGRRAGCTLACCKYVVVVYHVTNVAHGHWTWVVEKMLAYVKRMRSKHCRESNYADPLTLLEGTTQLLFSLDLSRSVKHLLFSRNLYPGIKNGDILCIDVQETTKDIYF